MSLIKIIDGNSVSGVQGDAVCFIPPTGYVTTASAPPWIYDFSTVTGLYDERFDDVDYYGN